MSVYFRPTGSSPMHDLFEKAYARANRTIPFDTRWYRTLTKYENLVSGPDAPSIPVGKVYTTRDSVGLKFILIGTRFGNVVVYQPSHDTEDLKDPIYMVQIPKEVQYFRWFQGSRLDERALRLAVGDETTSHIGYLLEQQFSNQEW